MTTAVHFPALGHDVKLGRAPKRVDERTAQFATYATSSLPTPPSRVSWGVNVPHFPMFANDSLGDCTCATVGHMEQAWTAMNDALWTPTTKEVTDLYWATGADDTGRVEIDILNYWRNVGFGDAKRKISGYMQVNPLNATQVKQAVWLFGGLYLGIALPISAQNQTAWKLTNGPDAAPGSWGGHAVNITAYTSTYLVCVTWGMRMRMSWGWFRKYVDEAYAVLSPDWANGTVNAPSGFNFDALQADLSLV